MSHFGANQDRDYGGTRQAGEKRGFGGTKSGNPTANTLDPVHARNSPALIRRFLRMGRVE
ncbi:hypothetical protein BH20CHL4_BH20CHL4_06380 [soil metagenome]